ncbi:MAG: ATP-binding protein [Alphaproteobacteria bacterium]
MNERRIVELQGLAQRMRVIDGYWSIGLLAIALIGALGLGWLEIQNAASIFIFVAGALYIRNALAARAMSSRTGELTKSTDAGLSLAAAEALIERLPDPLLLLDTEGRIIFSNSAANGLVVGVAPRRHISAVLRAPGVLEAVELVLRGNPPQTVEYSHLVPVERYIEAYVAPIPLKANGEREEGIGAIIVLHELTAQKRLEQMRADFVANASHELRTPLSSLSGFIDTLRGHARDDAAAREKFLEIMQDQAGRMRRLIEDLLSLSRIELNEHIRPEGRVSLPSVLRDVSDSLAPQAAARNVKLETVIEPGVIDVIGARDELIQVVQNLVDNAIKYGASGGRIIITAGNAGESEARKSSFVSVRDFGEGIAREHIPRLTERFYRIDVQRSRQTGGTGLGLAIVKHIVNRHRGTLSIESALGEGSTFTVILPQVAQGAPEVAVPEQAAAPQRLAQSA